MLRVPGVEALVHPYLDLFPHEVVVVREHHDQLIASVGCLAGEADVVIGLRGLNLRCHEAVASPHAVTARDLHLSEHSVSGIIETINRRHRHQLDICEISPVAIPERPLRLRPSRP